jgi:hypothetical protein
MESFWSVFAGVLGFGVGIIAVLTVGFLTLIFLGALSKIVFSDKSNDSR